MSKKILISSLVLTLLVVGALSCLGASNPEEVKIGVIYPLSGSLASTGQDMREGVELAADIINNKYPNLDIPMADWEGIPGLGGAKVKVVFQDHRADPARGADLAKKLIRGENVVGLMGCYNSSVTKTASKVAERYDVPFINGSSSSPSLTKRGFNWFWRTSPHDTFFTDDLFNLLEGLVEGEAPGVDAVPKEDIDDLAIAAENTEYGSAARELMHEFSEKRDMEFNIVESFEYSHGTPDVSSEAQKLVNSDADSYLFVPYISDAILFVRSLKSLKAEPNLIWGQDAGFINPDFPKTLGAEAVEGILTRTVFVPRLTEVKPVAGQINDLYKERVGENFSGASSRAFTGLQTWGYVLNQAGSTDPEAIAEAVNNIEIDGEELIMPWKGVKFGEAFAGDTHQNIWGSGVIAQYQDGVLEVIYPFHSATADMIYPFPGYKK